MAITTAVRQAKLKAEGAERYPMLPALMWTSATCLAELVDSYREALSELPGQQDNKRALTESDFEFRGGFCRCSRGVFPRTRIGESAFSVV